MASELMALLAIAAMVAISWLIALAIKMAARKYPPITPEQSRSFPSGVGGWLLFLIFTFMFLGPITSAGSINSEFISAESQYQNLKPLAAWGAYKTTTWLTFLSICCLSFYCGLSLMKDRDKSVVERAKIILWIIGPVAFIILNILIPTVIFGKFEFDPDAKLTGGLIGKTIWTIILVKYLSKSKRVRATYGYS